MVVSVIITLAFPILFSLTIFSIDKVFSSQETAYYNYKDYYGIEMEEKNLGKTIIQNYYLKKLVKDIPFELKSGLTQEDKSLIVAPFLEEIDNKIAFVMPTFTMAAYDDNAFYTFYKKYGKVTENEFVTSDLHLLTSDVPSEETAFLNYRSNGLKHLADRVSILAPNMKVSFFTDTDIHNALLFDQNGQNLYKFIILGHQEYVTQEEYSNFKKFVEDGGILILLNSNVFYTEVNYDSSENQVTLVQGHRWAFDGEKAWRDIKERWAEETTEWVGSNFGCGSSCSIHFNNNPFSYVHHEEQYITNPNAKILIDYQAESIYNYLIAAYELDYGKGKVISFGIFGDDVITNKNFLKFFDDLFLTHVTLV